MTSRRCRICNQTKAKQSYTPNHFAPYSKENEDVTKNKKAKIGEQRSRFSATERTPEINCIPLARSTSARRVKKKKKTRVRSVLTVEKGPCTVAATTGARIERQSLTTSLTVNLGYKTRYLASTCQSTKKIRKNKVRNGQLSIGASNGIPGRRQVQAPVQKEDDRARAESERLRSKQARSRSKEVDEPSKNKYHPK